MGVSNEKRISTEGDIMIWLIEIPAIVLVIAAMLFGSIQMGAILRTVGILIAIGSVLAFLWANSNDESGMKGASIFIGIEGILIYFFGVWFADHTIFEFLFGTGWF